MTYRSIVLSGPVAAGTTTAAKSLAEKLTLKYHSAGDFFRKYMQDHNIPLPNKETTKQTKKKKKKTQKKKKNFVFFIKKKKKKTTPPPKKKKKISPMMLKE